MIVPPTDEQLLAGLSAGDLQALVALYERYERPVYSFALQSLGDAAEAQLVLWLTLRRLWAEAAERPRQGPVALWVCQATQAVVAEHWRNRRVNAGGLAQPAADETAVYLLSRQLRRALLAMPSNLLRSLELAYFRGYTQAELARYLGVTPQVASERLAEAFQKLRATVAQTPAPRGLGRHGLDRVGAAAYACAQLPPEAAQRFAQHLVECKRCRREFAAYQAVCEALHLSVPQVEPSYNARVWMLRHIRNAALDTPLEPMSQPVASSASRQERPELQEADSDAEQAADLVRSAWAAELSQAAPEPTAGTELHETATDPEPEAAVDVAEAARLLEPAADPAPEIVLVAAEAPVEVLATAPEPHAKGDRLTMDAPAQLPGLEPPLAEVADTFAVPEQLAALPDLLPPPAVQPVPMAIAPLAQWTRQEAPPLALHEPDRAPGAEPKPRRPGQGHAELKPRRTRKAVGTAEGEVAVTAEAHQAAKPARMRITKGVLSPRPVAADWAAFEPLQAPAAPTPVAAPTAAVVGSVGRTGAASAATAVPAVAVARPRRQTMADTEEWQPVVEGTPDAAPAAAPHVMSGPTRWLLVLMGVALLLAVGAAGTMTYSAANLWRRIADLEYLSANRDVQLRQAEDSLGQTRQRLAAYEAAGATAELRVVNLQPASGNALGQAVFQSTGPGRGLQVHLAGVPALKGAQVLAVWLIDKNGTATLAGPSFVTEPATGRAGFTGGYKPSADYTRIVVSVEPDTAARSQPGTVLLSSDL